MEYQTPYSNIQNKNYYRPIRSPQYSYWTLGNQQNVSVILGHPEGAGSRNLPNYFIFS